MHDLAARLDRLEAAYTAHTAGLHRVEGALAANGETLDAILAEITKQPEPSDLATALRRLAEAVEANTAATERLVDERINAQRMASAGKTNGHTNGRSHP